MNATESMIYQDGTVQVSTSRAIVNGVTYAMANVTSVRMLVEPPSRGFATLMIGFGALLLIIGFSAGSFGTGFTGVIIGGIGVLIYMSQKANYLMLIGSSSGEKNALKSQDHNYIQSIVEAMNHAIIARG
jgi:hypothetical protein